MRGGVAATVLALAVLGATLGTIARTEPPAVPPEAERGTRAELERVLARAELALARLAGADAPPDRR